MITKLNMNDSVNLPRFLGVVSGASPDTYIPSGVAPDGTINGSVHAQCIEPRAHHKERII